MIFREFYKLSILSCVMSIGVLDLQLWVKYQAVVQISRLSE
jgi:hypothetical protein